MKPIITILSIFWFAFFYSGCSNQTGSSDGLTASVILGNPNYPAISYGGYRQNTREIVPTVEELKEDMKILNAMGVKILRTYNTQQYAQASNLLQAIRQLKDEDPGFEMYVMLGTWIECQGAWTASANHNAGNVENNIAEIQAAVEMINTYPDIVKIIAVGNEAMVQWAINYFVYPNVILKWVSYLQELKKSGDIPAHTWITSSDNYESWGGGAENYQTEDLAELIKAVDFVSLHTYPFHDSHYNPAFWGVPQDEENLSDVEKVDAAMLRAKDYAISQYQEAAFYIQSLGIKKTIHIGETGWATIAGSSYGATGSQASDEYKQRLYYQHMREWTNEAAMSCFYFEAFDEQWKDAGSALGSENHFGLINLKGQAKYALWDFVDNGTFDGLRRDGVAITKTYGGDEKSLMADLLIPPLAREMGTLEISTVNENRKAGETVTEGKYVIVSELLVPDGSNDISYPSAKLKLNAWEGTCGIEMSPDGIIEVATGTGAGDWWGCALEIQSEGIGENLSNFAKAYLNFDIKGNTNCTFNLGFQTGLFSKGNQVNNFITFGPVETYSITEDWKTYSIALSELDKGAILSDVNGIIYLRGETGFDGKYVNLKNLYYSKE